MDYGLEDASDDLIYNFDVWSGGVAGVSFQYMRENPEEAYEDLLDTAQEFEADKAAHIWASYSISRGTMEVVKYLDPDAGLLKRSGAAFLTTNFLMGAWEYNQMRNGAADPQDLGANQIGIGFAIFHEICLEKKDKKVEESVLNGINEALGGD